MQDKNILGKEQAFKVALVSEFNCQTFELAMCISLIGALIMM